ncbi:MAG: extracellular solute-binding protein [Betaproteobacteria bacterium]|nr:extracellular solute-binding protein [Betaproteobacteria bacterium]
MPSSPRLLPSSPIPGLRRRRLLGAALSTFTGSALLAGCSPQESPNQLTVAAYPQIDAVVEQALQSWRAQHPGVTVKVVTRQYGDHHTAMTTALSTAVGLPDVMALESSFVGRFAHGSGLEDLSAAPYEAHQLRDRFVAFAFDQGTNANGRVLALPTDIGPGTLLFRQDLLARAGVSVENLTHSWESFVDAGLAIKQKTGAFLLGNAQTLKDILIRSGLQPGQSLYFGSDHEVLVKSSRFERAFELALKVRRNQLDARVNAWSNEWAEGFKRGRLSVELSGAWMVGQMAKWVAPSTAGLWRAAHLPESTFVSYGGTFYAIPRLSNPQRKAHAWALIKHLTLDTSRQVQAFREVDAFPALSQALDEPFFDEPLPFLGGQPARQLWREAARRITAVSVHKQNSFADEVVGTELDNVLDRGKSITAALADAHRVLVRRARR